MVGRRRFGSYNFNVPVSFSPEITHWAFVWRSVVPFSVSDFHFDRYVAFLSWLIGAVV